MRRAPLVGRLPTDPRLPPGGTDAGNLWNDIVDRVADELGAGPPFPVPALPAQAEAVMVDLMEQMQPAQPTGDPVSAPADFRPSPVDFYSMLQANPATMLYYRFVESMNVTSMPKAGSSTRRGNSTTSGVNAGDGGNRVEAFTLHWWDTGQIYRFMEETQLRRATLVIANHNPDNPTAAAAAHESVRGTQIKRDYGIWFAAQVLRRETCLKLLSPMLRSAIIDAEELIRTSRRTQDRRGSDADVHWRAIVQQQGAIRFPDVLVSESITIHFNSIVRKILLTGKAPSLAGSVIVRWREQFGQQSDEAIYFLRRCWIWQTTVDSAGNRAKPLSNSTATSTLSGHQIHQAQLIPDTRIAVITNYDVDRVPGSVVGASGDSKLADVSYNFLESYYMLTQQPLRHSINMTNPVKGWGRIPYLQINGNIGMAMAMRMDPVYILTLLPYGRNPTAGLRRIVDARIIGNPFYYISDYTLPGNDNGMVPYGRYRNNYRRNHQDPSPAPQPAQHRGRQTLGDLLSAS